MKTPPDDCAGETVSGGAAYTAPPEGQPVSWRCYWFLAATIVIVGFGSCIAGLLYGAQS